MKKLCNKRTDMWPRYIKDLAQHQRTLLLYKVQVLQTQLSQDTLFKHFLKILGKSLQNFSIKYFVASKHFSQNLSKYQLKLPLPRV